MAGNRPGNSTNETQHAADADDRQARSEEERGIPENSSFASEEGGTADEPQVEMIGDDALNEGQPAENVQPELATSQDRLLRLQAEMENLRRRTAREIADERRYATLPMVRDLLEVLDNIDRAIEAGEKNADSAGLLEGFQLVARQLRSLLDRHHVKPIAAEGEPFDPNLHEAILQQPSDEPAGTVTMVTQQGYQLHDRVVRPSQVIVSAGKQDAGTERQ